MKNKIKIFLSLPLLLLTACGQYGKDDNPKIVSMQMLDRHGFNETISSPDRLERFEQTDFLQPQPYSKITRLFKSTKNANSTSIVTSYHENGQVSQCLEVENGRAHGLYREWYPSGSLKIVAHILEGIGDVSESCMGSWIFDKESLAYDENGHLKAKINYDKGDLSGISTYYYPSGAIRKTTPYVKNVIHGEEIFYDEQGEKAGFIKYSKGLKDGLSLYLGSSSCPKFTEEYKDGNLVTGKYFDQSENLVSVVQKGNGIQTIYVDGVIAEQFEFKNGIQSGKVYAYDKVGYLKNEYFVKDGMKHGEEWVYYPSTNKKNRTPKMCVNWYEGKIQGRVKSWYKNGQLESEKDMHNNQKNGLATAWYKDGSVMLIEEYERDLLMKGTYMKPKEKSPVSTIERGNGKATLYDSDGYFIKRIEYSKGVPLENQ